MRYPKKIQCQKQTGKQYIKKHCLKNFNVLVMSTMTVLEMLATQSQQPRRQMLQLFSRSSNSGPKFNDRVIIDLDNQIHTKKGHGMASLFSRFKAM
ncbi:hypothetical protein TNCT_446261 [Trichonephila clavata]|uniref:Uncharacterized protein n=1 Tax=Trichonephila clavata TaxID=2740835 RepID=A0A8X6L635_TRICU|nr:hypothetical protein TNCT_446261 [Trichonephila clavata]